jgi:hypothetical protein
MTTAYTEANDPYAGFSFNPETLGTNSVVVTPSDTVDFTSYPKGISVAATGNLVVLPLKAPDDGAHLITYTGVAAGFMPPFRVRRVMATGTTATVVTVAD